MSDKAASEEMQKLDPAAAAYSVDAGIPIFHRIQDISKFLGISRKRLLGYLRRGELTAVGEVTSAGIKNISIEARELIRFMAVTGLPHRRGEPKQPPIDAAAIARTEEEYWRRREEQARKGLH